MRLRWQIFILDKVVSTLPFPLNLLDSDKTLIAAVAYKGPAFIKNIKKRRDVLLMEMQSENENKVFNAVLREINIEPDGKNQVWVTLIVDGTTKKEEH